MSSAAGLRKRRIAVSKSIDRLVRRLANLEGKATEPSTFATAQEIEKGLKEQDQAYRDFHYQLLDLIDEKDGDTLDKEQEELDKHCDVMDDITMRVKQLLAASSASASSPQRKTLARKQSLMEKALTSIGDAVSRLTSKSDCHLIHQYSDRLRQSSRQYLTNCWL